MQPDTAIRRLEMLPVLARNGKPVNGLFRLLTHRPLWTTGLARIKRNKGAGTPGIDNTKVTDLGEAEIETLIQQLMEHAYKPVPVRRVHIPKSNGKMRPLGIPTAKDRLVQEVVRSLLDPIFETTFSNASHGFRKGRSCHTALEEIKKVWTGTKWIVEVDIKGYFDNIDHSILLKLLRRRIEDEHFVRLIESMLKAGFLEDWKYHDTHSGTPQGGIISPLLANIYLHELDVEMSGLIASFDKGTRRKQNRTWLSLQSKVKHARQRVEHFRSLGKDIEANQWLEKHGNLRKEMLASPPSDQMDPDYRRLRYIRYADDFLIGVIGSRCDAFDIMQHVRGFLACELNLCVSEEKSGVRKATDGVEFLGYGVKVFSRPSLLKVVKHSDGRRLARRSMTDRIQLHVPYEKIGQFASRHSYGNTETFKAYHRANLLHCDDLEIVDIYNSEIRGYANYYVLARDMKQRFARLELIWQSSLLKTLAAKHGITMMRAVRRYRVGPSRFVVKRSTERKTVMREFWRLADVVRASFYEVDKVHNTEWIRAITTNMTDRELASQCHFCGTDDGPFEIHHVNPMRNLKTATPLRRMKASRKRKTVVACLNCHKQLHHGVLPDSRNRHRGVESRVQ